MTLVVNKLVEHPIHEYVYQHYVQNMQYDIDMLVANEV
jgi:hypothetical protein